MTKLAFFYSKWICILAIIFVGFSSFSEEKSDTAQQSSAPKSSLDLFNDGLKLFQAKDFTKALSTFEKSSQLDPKNESALMNMGLAALELKKVGLALAAFRKVLTLNPTHSEAIQGIQYVQHQFEIKEIPHQIEFYQALRDYFLVSQSIHSYLTLFAILVLAVGIISIRYLSALKTSETLEKAPPTFPYIGTLLSILLLVCIGLMVAKSYDLTLERGTIISNQIAVRTAPGEDQASLFDLYEGLEVVILHSSSDWLQVQYPGGLAGWIPKSALLKTQ